MSSTSTAPTYRSWGWRIHTHNKKEQGCDWRHRGTSASQAALLKTALSHTRLLTSPATHQISLLRAMTNLSAGALRDCSDSRLEKFRIFVVVFQWLDFTALPVTLSLYIFPFPSESPSLPRSDVHPPNLTKCSPEGKKKRFSHAQNIHMQTYGAYLDSTRPYIWHKFRRLDDNGL